MAKIDFGVGMSMPVRPEQRERAENFCKDVLQLPQTLATEQYSCFRFPNGQVLGITPEEGAPTEADYENSIWLEMVAENFEEMKAKMIEFGVREVKGGMPEAFFFNIPGGAVFRLLSQEMAAEQAQ